MINLLKSFFSNEKNSSPIRDLEIINLKDQIGFLREENEKLHAINRSFFNILKHDMRSPLQAILFSLNHLNSKLGIENPNMAEIGIIKGVSNTIRQLQAYSLDFVNFHSVIQGDYVFNIKEYRVSELIREVEEYSDHVFSNHTYTIETKVADTFTILTDKGIFITILRNILINAILYGSGEIVLDNKLDGTKSSIVISNGIPENSSISLKAIQAKIEGNSNLSEPNDKFKLGISSISYLAKAIGIDYSFEIYENTFIICLAY